ncbi:MAG: hypothetical protein ABSF64_26540 [Bryobacteraceae bacterium]|jgi:hypothetical protein
MLNPAAVYRFLAQQPAGRDSRWLGWRKPLLVAFILGCTMSLIASARLTLRLAGPATTYWSFVPLAEIAALAAVWRRGRTLSFRRTVDLFFAGHGPWLFWLIGLCAIWCFVPPIQAFVFTTVWLYGAGAMAIVWSAYIDFCFFRFVMDRAPARAGRDLLLHRLISWTLIIAIFGGPAIPPEIAGRLGAGFGP